LDIRGRKWQSLEKTNGELHNLYASPNIARMITSRRMRRCACRMDWKEMHTVFWLENLKRRDHSEELGIDGRIILERIIQKYKG
jgi:hypothetical protein